jgi:hypothetical protein
MPNDALYAVAADPARDATAFVDVTEVNNRIYKSVDGCDTGEGYHPAGGLGEVHIDVTAGLLVAARNTVPVAPPTTAPPAAAVVVTPGFTG